MAVQQPPVADPGYRSIGYFRNAVGISQTVRSQTGQDGFELIRVKADQIEIEMVEVEIAQLGAELLGVPARPRRQLIVGQPIGALLILAPTPRHDPRDGFQPQLCRRADTRFAGRSTPSSSTSTGIVHPHLR